MATFSLPFEISTGTQPTQQTIQQIGVDLDAIATQFNSLPIATKAQYLANTPGFLLTTDVVWSAAVPVQITFSTSITPDLSTLINGYVTLTNNFTLNLAVNGKGGQFGVIKFIQDMTGGRVWTINTGYKFQASVGTPILSTAPNAVDLLYYYLDEIGVYRCALVKGT